MWVSVLPACLSVHPVIILCPYIQVLGCLFGLALVVTVAWNIFLNIYFYLLIYVHMPSEA